jgi:hypothetical protein
MTRPPAYAITTTEPPPEPHDAARAESLGQTGPPVPPPVPPVGQPRKVNVAGWE